jgi:hypothetical protein
MGKALLNLEVHTTAIKNGVIKPDDLKKVILWLDGNSDELGAFNNQADQKNGKVVWPDLDVDPKNPTGVEEGVPTIAYRTSDATGIKSMNAAISGKLVVLKNIPTFSGRYTCQILDGFGRSLILYASESKLPDHRLSFTINNLAHGSYIVRLNAEGKNWMTKVCYYQ